MHKKGVPKLGHFLPTLAQDVDYMNKQIFLYMSFILINLLINE